MVRCGYKVAGKNVLRGLSCCIRLGRVENVSEHAETCGDCDLNTVTSVASKLVAKTKGVFTSLIEKITWNLQQKTDYNFYDVRKQCT